MEELMGKKIDVKWNRVVGTGITTAEKEKQERNKSVLKSPDFEKACAAVDIKVTKRQASKWNNKKGKAYKFSKGMIV